MNALLTGMKTTLILFYISIRALEWSGALSMNSNVLKGIFFPLSSWSQQWGLKHSVNHVINRCAVIQALLFHLYSTGRVVLA